MNFYVEHDKLVIIEQFICEGKIFLKQSNQWSKF